MIILNISVFKYTTLAWTFDLRSYFTLACFSIILHYSEITLLNIPFQTTIFFEVLDNVLNLYLYLQKQNFIIHSGLSKEISTSFEYFT